MKKFTKRSLAWFAALMLFISAWASMVVLPAEAAVTYKYSGSYVYNWGKRDQTATFLSPMAEAFYSANNVTYASLAALSGSSTNSSVPSSALYKKLHQLMYNNLDNPTSYEDTKNLFKLTDCQNNASSSTKISSFYSGASIGPAWDSGSTWNREHTWPNSKSNGGSSSNTLRETDIMMLRPASVSENSGRSNTAYGEGSSYYDPNKLGENVRGDVARIVLYVYVCWGGSSYHDGALDYMWGTSGVIQSKTILLKWMEEDPVDTWEMGRNDSVESITGTRNVFVDYPELAFKLFGSSVPSGYESPSGGGSGSSSSGYTVKASTNNSNYGTVSVSGNVITASPKTGYAVSSYSILSGTATVTQNGNKFTVNATSDVSVRINFAKRDELTLQFVQSGVTSSITAYAGDGITLPTHSGAVPAGCTFLGWVSHEVAESTTMPTTYYTAGTTWYVNKAMILYALYARGGVSSNNLYTSYGGSLTEGDYVIVYNGGALIAEVGSAGRFGYLEVDTTTGAVEDPAANAVWHIAADGSNWTLYNAAVGAYAGGTGVKNKGALLTTLTDYGRWTVTVSTGGYEFVNVGNTAAGVNANLRRNGTYGYACYGATTGGALTLYKLSSGGNGTSYFTVSGAAACSHQYSNACDATCNLCGTTRVPADHVYVSQVITAATCGQEGVCTYTCSVCAVTYTEVIAATGEHRYDNACDANCNICGGGRTSADHVYTAACDTICNVCGAERTTTSGEETTIVFDDDKTQRVEFSTTVQVWENGVLTVTNNKTASSTNVADYSNPVRFYKNSEVIIAYPGMTKLVIVADTSSEGKYATPWAETLDNAGLIYTEADGVYTIVFDTPVDSVSLIATAQVRAKSISAAGAGAEHEYKSVVTAPDCEKGGYTTYICANCGDTYTADETAALGHDYDNACDADCNTCGDIREVGDHIYDNANDATCNACGAVRQIALQIISGGLTSVSEDVNGLAFRFDATMAGAQTLGTAYVNGSATVIPFASGESYAVVRMGAVVTNLEGTLPTLENVDGDYIVDVEAKYLFYHDAECVSFAIRIINIEDLYKDRLLTARPYYVILVEGEEVVIYGDIVTKSYNEAAN